MIKHRNPPERVTVAFWHPLPKDDAWRQVTLASHERNSHGLQPMCRSCWHVGEKFTPVEFSTRYGVPMDAPMLMIQRRLRCTSCGLPSGYFNLLNPLVRRHE